MFVVGADLISQGRRVQIRFAMPEPDRPEFLRRLRTVSRGAADCGAVGMESTDQTPTHPDKIITPIPLISPTFTRQFCPLETSTAESGLKRINRWRGGGTRIFSPLAVAGLCVTIGRYVYLFKRLTAVPAGRFYRFEHIVTYSSGKVVAKSKVWNVSRIDVSVIDRSVF